MQEFINKKVNTNEIDEMIKTYQIFDWEVDSKNIINEYKTYITFKRETSTPYYQKIVELEKKWNKETNFPSWPTYLFISISILIVTAYLIVSIVNGFEDKLLYFLSIMLPGLLFLVLGASYSFIRIKKLEKIISTYYEKRREYSLIAERIKKNENI